MTGTKHSRISLITLPTELILRIFSWFENFSHAIAFSSSCKDIHSTWLAHSCSIIWHVGEAHIFAFNDALIAARATKTVLDHFHQGQLPPDPFPIESLSGRVQRPSLEELKLVLDFEHLVLCIENIYSNTSRWTNKTGLFSVYPKHRVLWKVWRENFHRSMYRVFSAGAVLFRAYQEPLILDHGRWPPDFLKGFSAREGSSHSFHRPLTDEEEKYLMRFPVYNFEDYEQHGPIYEPLAQLFLRESRNRAQKPECWEARSAPLPCFAKPNGMKIPEAQVLWEETVQCIFAFEQLNGFYRQVPIIYNPDIGRVSIPGLKPIRGRARKVSVILLRRFFPIEISMPACVQDAYYTLLIEKPINPQPGQSLTTLNTYSQDVDLLLSFLQSYSTYQPRYYDQHSPIPHPPLQAFQYIFRRYLGLRFHENAFHSADSRNLNAYGRFAERGEICFAAADLPKTEVCKNELLNLVDSADKVLPYVSNHAVK